MTRAQAGPVSACASPAKRPSCAAMRAQVAVPFVIAACCAAAAAPASAYVVDCRISASETQVVSSARNMTCLAAARDVRRTRKSISYSFTSYGGFRCQRVSGMELGGQWRCVKGARAYRFEFAD